MAPRRSHGNRQIGDARYFGGPSDAVPVVEELLMSGHCDRKQNSTVYRGNMTEWDLGISSYSHGILESLPEFRPV